MNLNSDAWRDLVFEGKNKEYGAYYLRKTSSKRHLYALMILICMICVLVLSFYVWGMFRVYDGSIYRPMLEIKPFNLFELSMVEYVIPETKEKKPEKNIKNTPPKIVADEEDIPEPEPVEQIEALQVPVDSTSLTPVDSTILAENKLRLSEITDEEAIYVLNPTDSISKSQSLQTTILRYVYHHLKYPDAAYKQKIKGKVVYSFVVNGDGVISDVTLIKGVYVFLDEEVLRVIRSMPIMEPEKKDGKPIRVKFYLPVVFS